MESYTEIGSWQSNTCAGAVSLVPAFAASYDATAASFAGSVLTDATAASFAVANAAATGLGQPKTMRTHKSITRPGNPPRGRIR